MFIDRDPRMFRFILAYLREAKSGATVAGVKEIGIKDDERAQLLTEAKHFRISRLAGLLQTPTVRAIPNTLTMQELLMVKTAWEANTDVESITSLRPLSFRGMKLAGVSFRGFVFCRSHRLSRHTYEAGTDFSFADLRGCDFSHATLMTKTAGDYVQIFQTTFANADLRGCNFEGTDLSKCNTAGAIRS